MASDLVYIVIYNCFIHEFLVREYVNISLDPIQLWYPTLWRHKSPFFIYQFHDAFLGRCREIFIGVAPAPITKEAKYFMRRKGQLYIEDEHTYFRMYGFEGTSFLYPRFVTYLFLNMLTIPILVLFL